MTINRARKLIGKQSIKYSDDEIESILIFMESLAEGIFPTVWSQYQCQRQTSFETHNGHMRE